MGERKSMECMACIYKQYIYYLYHYMWHSIFMALGSWLMDRRFPGNWITARLETIINTRATRGGFRLGQAYDVGLVEAASRRCDFCYFWTTGIVEKAMRDGYIVRQKDKEPVEWWTEFKRLNWLEEQIRGITFERKFGASTFGIFDNWDKEPSDLIAFAPRRTKFLVDPQGHFTAFLLTEVVGGSNLPVPHKIRGENLENVFHEVLRPDEKKYQGISVLEPVWDLASARAIVIQSMAIHTARVASGIRKATVASRDDKTEDDTVVALIELGLARLEADDHSIVLRSGVTPAGHAWEDKLEIDTGGTQYNYTDKIEIIHKGLSIGTGIPKNYYDGIFYGSLYASDSILRMLHTALKTIQDQWTFRIEKQIQRWCELNKHEWSDEFYLDWGLKPKLTEKEEAELEFIKATTQATLKNAGIIDTEDARASLKLKEKIIVQPRGPLDIAISGLDNKEQTEA